ncbi:hypothetical protein DERP_001111 [Dermatophagoides pteronyssinus]|uniref:Uncharacterized protein n=1 Tax=Dermatophagoides pteronyssinus TaxID=6956 RepID=A0ABQ8JDJ0_DERPT|nr:hypothetical protein DERP_001111 [Dermatophagoides pteronyssinus]
MINKFQCKSNEYLNGILKEFRMFKSTGKNQSKKSKSHHLYLEMIISMILYYISFFPHVPLIVSTNIT